jgi:hypothetical protein
MTKKHYKAMQWCISNNIYVSAYPTTIGTKVEIINNGKTFISPNTYTKKQLDFKIWELYLYLYDQNN